MRKGMGIGMGMDVAAARPGTHVREEFVLRYVLPSDGNCSCGLFLRCRFCASSWQLAERATRGPLSKTVSRTMVGGASYGHIVDGGPECEAVGAG